MLGPKRVPLPVEVPVLAPIPSQRPLTLGSVKRTTPEARHLTRTLVKEGYSHATERRLERWTHENHLGPQDDADFQTKLEHFRALAKISRSGVDADVTARRLAARGFACERLRPAILRELGLAPLEDGEVIVQSEPDPNTDTGFAAIELLASSIDDDTKGVPPLLVQIMKALKRNARRRASETGRTADEIFHSFLVNGLSHLMGGDIYDPGAFAAVFDVEAGEVPLYVIDEINARIRPNMHDIDETYRNIAVERVVLISQRLTQWAPSLLDHLEITRATDAEIEDLATMMAPFLSYFFDLLRGAYEDFPDELSWDPPELASAPK